MSKKTGRKGKAANKKQTVASAVEADDVAMIAEFGDIQNIKRPQLQKLCKQFGLKATGKVRH